MPPSLPEEEPVRRIRNIVVKGFPGLKWSVRLYPLTDSRIEYFGFTLKSFENRESTEKKSGYRCV